MTSTALVEHAALVPLALVLVVLGSTLIGHLVLRRRPRLLTALLGLALLPVVVLTLVPSGTSRGDDVGCTVQFAVPTLGSVELLANVALFLPPALLGTLLTRRPLLVLAAAAALSGAIEALQALVPALGRACDTNDWLMNTAGASVGVALAVVLLALTDRREDGRMPAQPR
ncbi:VanZ family protein [Modestobacter italicus]|uniref:VanZ family protein n=1 Tax=Modestobacter italicus (strain DSM 44449 / CECT 9708 / BC 501) TaxID=2732864 RepID=UPI001C9867B7|nr:VanZ family protein [Modestobacter italicus]